MYRAQPNVMTASWIMPLSLEPARVGVAIHPDRLTHTFVSRTEVLGISVPTLDHLAAIHGCGMLSGNDLDKFERFSLTPGDPEEIDAPWVVESVARLECGVVERHVCGDHHLFTCEVINAFADPAAFMETWLPENEVALVHHLGGDRYTGMGREYRAPDPMADEDD
jgi:flavin reductase (DIM6/NTAB) family NADH-FMN oxidoreductase RutF